MILQYAEISNLLSFGENVKIDFRSDDVTLVTGERADTQQSNGSGKSALFEAVYWCLTGKTIRGVTAKSVVRSGCKGASVTVRFLYGEDVWEVSRYWSNAEKRMDVSLNGNAEEFHDSKQATEWIFDRLNITKENLALACFYGRNLLTVSQMSPSQRAALVDEIVGGQRWLDAKANAKQMKTEKSALHDAQQANKDSKYNDVERLKAQFIECEKKLEHEKDLQATELSVLKAKLSEGKTSLQQSVEMHKSLEDSYQKAKKDYEDVKSASNAKEAELEKLRSTKINIMSKQKENEIISENVEKTRESDKRKITDNCKNACERIEKLIKDLNASSDRIKKSVAEQKCPECGQNIKDDKVNSLLETVAKQNKEVTQHSESAVILLGTAKIDATKVDEQVVTKIETLKTQSTELARELIDLDETLSSTANSHKEEETRLYSEFSSKLEVMDKVKKDLKSEEESVAKIERSISTLENSKAIAELGAQKSILIATIQSTEEEVKVIGKNITELSEVVNICKFWENGFRDIRFNLFDEMVSSFGKLIELFAKRQGLDVDSIQMSSSRMAADDKTKIMEVTIAIVRGGVELSVDGLSEGERQRLDFACFLAQHHVIERKSSARLKLAVFDEPMNGVDADGREKMFELFNSFGDERQVFVIDHNSHFKDSFPSSLKVTKRETSEVQYE